jgi:hypothetical protein
LELDRVFDSEGVLLFAEAARRTFAASTPFPPCARAGKMSITCAPEDAISKGAMTLLLISAARTQEFERWSRASLENANREREIAALFKPAWCTGLTIANIIGSGYCGGMVTDHHKNTKRAASLKESEDVKEGDERDAHRSAPNVNARHPRRT